MTCCFSLVVFIFFLVFLLVFSNSTPSALLKCFLKSPVILCEIFQPIKSPVNSAVLSTDFCEAVLSTTVTDCLVRSRRF